MSYRLVVLYWDKSLKITERHLQSQSNYRSRQLALTNDTRDIPRV